MAPIYENRVKRCINNNHKANLPSLQRTLINRNYAKLWYGQAVSAVGDSVFGTTLVLWVSQVLASGRSWAPAAVSGILVSAGAAFVLVGPVAGVFVDRWNRKSTMMRTEVIRAATVMGLTGMSFVPVRDLPLGLWLAVVYLVVFVLTAAGQFFSPARFATTGDVVHGEEDRARAVGLAEATTSAAWIIGPPIAAPLLFTVGLQWALTANAASYVVSYLAIRFLRVTPEPHPPAPAGAGETSLHAEFFLGLRLFARNRFLVTLLSVTMICQCGTGAINTLNVFFVTRDLHASSHLFGVAETAIGSGWLHCRRASARPHGSVDRCTRAHLVGPAGRRHPGGRLRAAAQLPRRPGHAGGLRRADRHAEHRSGAAAPGCGTARIPGPGDGGVQSGQPARVHGLGGRLRLADEHRPAKLPRLVRRRHPQLGQPDLHHRRRPDLRVRYTRVRSPALRFRTPGAVSLDQALDDKISSGRSPERRHIVTCRRAFPPDWASQDRAGY